MHALPQDDLDSHQSVTCQLLPQASYATLLYGEQWHRKLHVLSNKRNLYCFHK
jgi:hypothetical protein